MKGNQNYHMLFSLHNVDADCLQVQESKVVLTFLCD